MNAYKFSPTATSEQPDILQGETEIDWIKAKFHGSSMDNNLQRQGIYKIAGWSFDFKPFLKRFIVRQYDQWSVYYAPNKTICRKCIYGKIDEIYEIPKL